MIFYALKSAGPEGGVITPAWKTFLTFKLSDALFVMLINVKMPTTVGILTYANKC